MRTSKTMNEIKQECKKNLSERKNMDKKLSNGCIPVRRRIASGGKVGSYADARTGGKQAYAALKKAKPPGSKGGWTKKNCICCHKCPNDRSAPNGYVCKNPAHLYWGSKADNTYDQNRGNGWAAKNEMTADEKAFSTEIIVSESPLRLLISKLLLEEFQANTDIFGKQFLKFRKAVNSGADPLAYAKKNLKQIGSGSTRVVFEFSDNPYMILKVINTDSPLSDEPLIASNNGEFMTHYDEEGRARTIHGFFKKHMQQSNQWEADLNMQQKFPDVFPRTYEHDDNFTWILAEKAEVFDRTDYDKIFNILGVRRSQSDLVKPLARKRAELLDLIRNGIDYYQNPNHYMRRLRENNQDTFLLDDDLGDNDSTQVTQATYAKRKEDTNSIKNIDQIIPPPPPAPPKSQEEDTNPYQIDRNQKLKDLISNPHNRKILGAMGDLKIPYREFLPQNLGISTITGKLLIIDASLWEEHKKIRE